MTRLLPLVLGILLPSAAFAATDKLEYQTPAGVAFTVTADGLSAIGFQQRELARGGWAAENGEGWFKDGGSGAVAKGKVTSKTIEVLGPDHARVRHQRDDLLAVYDYQFAGEDLTISTRLENLHASEDLRIVRFAGLRFVFSQPPEGYLLTQHISYFQAHGVELCHPGYWAPIGGSYATDDQIGVGVSPWRTGLTRTLILWDYADWAADKREKFPQRLLNYFVVSPVPARGARTLDVRLRVSPNRAWQHLLEPYREHFQATFGPVQYHADYRWIATDYLNHSRAAIKPDNPYGFHGGHRRIDTPDGAAKFCDLHLKALQDGNGQGVIVWGQGGEEPRGGMYRPDFDVLPPEVAAQWPTIAQRFKEAGRKLGVCTRPRDMAVRANWQNDTIIGINPDDAGHRAMLWKRFRTMMDQGCTLFYLDSFGDSFEDVKLMRYLRQQMGPEVLTFAEHQCDAMLPYSGGYSETTFTADDQGGGNYRVWSGLRQWELYQWLVPGGQLAARLYEVKGKLPAGFEPVDRFYLRHRVTTLLPAFDASRVASLRELEPQFLDTRGQWKIGDGAK